MADPALTFENEAVPGTLNDQPIVAYGCHFDTLCNVRLVGSNNRVSRASACQIHGASNRVETAQNCTFRGANNVVANDRGGNIMMATMDEAISAPSFGPVSVVPGLVAAQILGTGTNQLMAGLYQFAAANPPQPRFVVPPLQQPERPIPSAALKPAARSGRVSIPEEAPPTALRGTCNICVIENRPLMQLTDCRHNSFCSTCLRREQATKGTLQCPVCRTRITSVTFMNNADPR